MSFDLSAGGEMEKRSARTSNKNNANKVWESRTRYLGLTTVSGICTHFLNYISFDYEIK